MNVVVVLDNASVNGGQAKVAIESAVGLAGRGHAVTLFAAVGPVDPRLPAAGVEVVCLGGADFSKAPRILGATQGFWNGRVRRALRSLLARRPIGETVVHVHGWAKALSPSIAGPLAASGHPVVYTMHEYFLLCPNGGFYDYRRHEHCHRTPGSLACLTTNCDARSHARKLWRFARHEVTTRVARLQDVFGDILYLTEFQRDVMAPHLPPGAALHHVPNPIEARDLGPKPDPAAGDFVFVGRLSPEKGVFLFAEAARRAGVVPVFVGDGPSAAELARRYPEARLLGWHDGDGVARRLREARALVFSSLWYETQGLVVWEAQALGTPAIVSDGCTAREGIVNGRTGLTFRSHDADDLARAMREMMDETRVAAMSRAAYETYWAAPPTLDVHLDRIEAVYGGALARRPVREGGAVRAALA